MGREVQIRFYRGNLYLQLLPSFGAIITATLFCFSGISGETPFYERGELGIHDSDDRIGLCDNVHINRILGGGDALTGCSILCSPNRSHVLLIYFSPHRPHLWRPLLLQHCHLPMLPSCCAACSVFVPFRPLRKKGVR